MQNQTLINLLDQIFNIIGINSNRESFIRQLADTAQLDTVTKLLEYLPIEVQQEMVLKVQKSNDTEKLELFYQVFGKDTYSHTFLDTLGKMLGEIINDVYPTLNSENQTAVKNLLFSISSTARNS